MPKTDPPRPSPRPNIRPDLGDDEPQTDPRLQAAFARHEQKLTLRSVGFAIAAVAGTVVAGILFVDNRVAAQTDAGVAVIKAEQKGLDARVTTMEKRLDRVDDKLDLLLDAARVPQWKRPAPLDGGRP